MYTFYYLISCVTVFEVKFCCNPCALLYYKVLFVTMVEAGYCCNDCAILYYTYSIMCKCRGI